MTRQFYSFLLHVPVTYITPQIERFDLLQSLKNSNLCSLPFALKRCRVNWTRHPHPRRQTRVMSQVSDLFEILSDEPSQGQIDTSADISILAFEPSIIKGRMGERLWHAQATPECVPLCKSQLKVNHYPSWLMYRMKPKLSNLPLRPRRIPILGLNIWRRLIHRRDSHMSLASIARPYTVIRTILYIKTPAR